MEGIEETPSYHGYCLSQRMSENHPPLRIGKSPDPRRRHGWPGACGQYLDHQPKLAEEVLWPLVEQMAGDTPSSQAPSREPDS